MSKKIRCTVTGNIFYVTEKRYARLLLKYGGEEGVNTKYVSQKGKKIRDGEIEPPNTINNRIKCSVTGRWCYISNPRIEAGMLKHGTWEEFSKHYVCRPVARLMREGKTKEEIIQLSEKGLIPEK